MQPSLHHCVSSPVRNALRPVVVNLPSGSKTSPKGLGRWSSASSEAQRRNFNLIAAARRGLALKELETTRQEEVDSRETVTKLEWDSPLSIIKYPDPRLRAKNARIGVFDATLARLADELLQAMYNGDDGVGLAAPQVGVNVRLMVYNPTGNRRDESFVLVNPKIVSTNNKREVIQEGCLSFPQIFAEVERPTQIKVKAQDLTGAKMKLTLEGWRARIFQHEYDHLEGVLFHDRMIPAELAKVKPKLQKLEEEFQAQHPGVPIRKIE